MMRILGLLVAVACTGLSWAQTAARPASITAVGSATVSVSPDLAHVDVGVVNQAATAQDATANNATQATAVINALRTLLGTNADIKTVSYSVSPVFNNPPAGQNAMIIGYSVTNIVEVTLTDLTQVGKVIDTSIQAGANRVQGISFALQDPNPSMAQALKSAAARARTQADAIAAGLNVHTGAVLHASEGVNTLSPVLSGAPVAAAATPIQTGLVVVTGSVTLEVALAP